MTDTTASGRPQSLNVFLDPEQYDFLRRQWSDQYIWSPAPVPGDIPLHRTAFISDLDEKEAAEEEAERQKREEEARRKRGGGRQQQLEEEEFRTAEVADDDAPATQTGDDEGSERAGDPNDEGLPDLADANESGWEGSGHRKRDSAISVASRSSRSSQGHTLLAKSARRQNDGGETLPSPPRRPAYGPTSRPLPSSRGEAADIKGPRTTARKPFRRPAPIIINPNPRRLRSFHLPALRGDGDRSAKENSSNGNNSNTNKDTQVTGLPIIASPIVDVTPYANQPIMASPTQKPLLASPERDADADTNYTHGPAVAPESEADFSPCAPAPMPAAAKPKGNNLQAQTPRGSRAHPFTLSDAEAMPPSGGVTSPPPTMVSQNVIPEAARVGRSMPPVRTVPVAPVAPALGIAAASTAPVPDATTKAASTWRNQDGATSRSPFPSRADRAAHKGKSSSLPSNLPSTSHQNNTKATSPSGGLAPPPGLQRARSTPAPPAVHKRSLTLQLDLNIDVEVELQAKIGGDLTLTLF